MRGKCRLGAAILSLSPRLVLRLELWASSCPHSGMQLGPPGWSREKQLEAGPPVLAGVLGFGVRPQLLPLSLVHCSRGGRAEGAERRGGSSACAKAAVAAAGLSRTCLHMPDSDGLKARVWWLVADVDEVNSEYLFLVTRQAHFQYSSLTFLWSRQCRRKRKKPCRQLRMEKM